MRRLYALCRVVVIWQCAVVVCLPLGGPFLHIPCSGCIVWASCSTLHCLVSLCCTVSLYPEWALFVAAAYVWTSYVESGHPKPILNIFTLQSSKFRRWSVCLFVCEYQAAIAMRDSDCKKDVFTSQLGPPISHICTDHSSFGPGLALGLGPAGQSGPTVNKENKNTAIEHEIEKEPMWKGLVGLFDTLPRDPRAPWGEVKDTWIFPAAPFSFPLQCFLSRNSRSPTKITDLKSIQRLHTCNIT